MSSIVFPLSISFHTYSSKPNPYSQLTILSSSISKPSSQTQTPPWIKAPPSIQESNAFSLPKTPVKTNKGDNSKKPDDKELLLDRVIGRRGKYAMKKIVQTIEKLDKKDQTLNETQKRIESYEVGFLLKDEGKVRGKERMPWEREEKVVFRRTKKEKKVTKAELLLDAMLLHRLRNEGKKMGEWVKVKKAGVTQAVVDEIKDIWRWNELAMIKFDVPLCRNMDRAHEIVEMKTGGLVIWSKKDTLVVYRGCDSAFTSKLYKEKQPDFPGSQEAPSSKFSCTNLEDEITQVRFPSELKESTLGLKIKEGEKEDGEKERASNNTLIDENMLVNGSFYEREVDRLLDSLGPRFTDWWMNKPLPVDADMLPEVVPGYRPPFRLCPPKIRSKLTDDELTYLRKLARPLPTHFVLGRNRKLQGLASAILKLWEKSHIVKIAVKWGVQNTNNEQIAYELKNLTGGILILRNKFCIIMYRGKDFLPSKVADLVIARDVELREWQRCEEDARLKAVYSLYGNNETSDGINEVGTLSEFQNIETEFWEVAAENGGAEVQLEAEKERLEKELRRQKRKLFILNVKKARSSKELLKLDSSWKRSEKDVDQEMLTQEERECLRKVALKMGSNLLLGRRGIFDGVMEGLYQHWKHREVAKVITMQRSFSQIINTATMLEEESGGILVSIEKLKEGHAIVLYRGKNYRRPPKWANKNLLTKRKALHRSLERQRIGSLKYFAYRRQQEISYLKSKLASLQEKCGLEVVQNGPDN